MSKLLLCRRCYTVFAESKGITFRHSLIPAAWLAPSKRKASLSRGFKGLAEEGGFEPPVQFPVRQFSKLLVSATHPSLLNPELEFYLSGANVEMIFRQAKYLGKIMFN